ncbi:MAG TPA: cytochrome c peroxidase [Blastocatellia bacterium]|nr:cytochrome c peroxidase [Blastocatellia bacterium]
MTTNTDSETTLLTVAVWLRCGTLITFLAFMLAGLAGWTRGSAQAGLQPQQARLGERLFKDARFSTSKGDFPASCSTCHLYDEDPQGRRAYADFLNRSWVSYRFGDPRRNELRNSPTIFDVAESPRLHFDGEFGSLEELVKGTFAGRPMGWLPGEQPQAFAQIQAIVLSDKGDESGAGSYRELFRKTYGIELEKLSRDEVVSLVARAVADFVRSLASERNSPWDQFIRINNLDAAPASGEDAKAFARRLLAKVSGLENKSALRLPKGFSADALRGLKFFFRTEGATPVGNCVACHAPPLFTDFSFHNIGISQVEYDQMHGAGKFATLVIPDSAGAVRPSARFRETPTREKPGEADLGFWNFVDLKSPSLRRSGESDDELLRRMIGAFKTPTLRHLAYTYPYMHTGAYGSLEDAVAEIMRLSEMARAGQVREADEELKRIRISQSDIAPLVAFLGTLSGELNRNH